MKVKIIYLECSRYCGIMRLLFNQDVWSFELGTPNFNDYGEYRLSLVNGPIPLKSYVNKFKNSPMIDEEICELSELDLNFWERLGRQMVNESDELFITDDDSKFIEMTEDGSGHVVCGEDKDKIFHVYYNHKWVNYEDVKKEKDLNSYAKVMLPSSEIFFKWYNRTLKLNVIPNLNDPSLNVYVE